MTHDQINDAAARVLLAASLPPFAIVHAEYAPNGTVPAWATQYTSVRTEWLANGDVEHMTSCPLPLSLNAAAQCVPISELRAIALGHV